MTFTHMIIMVLVGEILIKIYNKEEEITFLVYVTKSSSQKM